ncbi:hypothetical protein KEM55_002854, partial [Ascosphaera atra]
VEEVEEQGLAAATKVVEGERDDGPDRDEAASESHPSLSFTAINTPSHPSAGQRSGGNPGSKTLLAARHCGDSPPLELVFSYQVHRDSVDESAALLLPVSVVRGKHVGRSS